MVNTNSKKEVRNILFDLGGVILELDRPAHEAAFRKLARAPFEDVRSRVVNDPMFKSLEMGKVSMAEFRNFLRQVIQEFWKTPSDRCELSDEVIDSAWRTVIRGFPKQNLVLLQDLRAQGFKLGLFSNINPMHFAQVKEVFERDTGQGFETFESYFEGRAYFSHLEGMIKPYPESFEKILAKAGFQAGETLFLDDTSEHIEGASSLGIHTRLTDIQDVLKIQEFFTNRR
ncbi:MAG: HAD family phosphatase [Bdellovibrio sp.]|nr:HAD family phosphatase [Bdellovibrio sp.]